MYCPLNSPPRPPPPTQSKSSLSVSLVEPAAARGGGARVHGEPSGERSVSPCDPCVCVTAAIFGFGMRDGASVHCEGRERFVMCVVCVIIINPFPATFQYTGTSARLLRDRLPCDSSIEATTPF